MKKKYILFLLLAVLYLGYLYIGNPMVAYHNHTLKESITSLKGNEIVTLDAVVPFAWDKVYTLAPYTTKEEMAEIIGFQSGSLHKTVNEGMVQLLFVKGQRVTASVCGYASALGYRISFDSPLSYGEETLFTADTRENIVHLMKQET